jgi:GrpB-like predicted nucleotidyltransferase (UPF0157 family)
MPLSFSPEPVLRDVIELRRRLAFAELATLLPEARLEHVGSSAVPGGWTNGVVDILVRVDKKGFAAAQGALGKRFAADGNGKAKDGLGLFRDVEGGLRVYLAVAGSEHDDLVEKRELMRGHPLLRERYDAVRRRHNRGDEASYQVAKDRFWAVLMAP